MSSDPPTFAATGLVKRYGSVYALAGLTCQAPWRTVGLLGPNGAGKSTLVKVLLGLSRATSGQAQVLGRSVPRQIHQVRSRVGYFPEDEVMFPGMEGIVAVAYAGELCGLSWRDALKRAHGSLDYVGLAEERYREVTTYSTGMKQRLKLAQALVHDPELLILDEPTNGMDPAGREEILALLRYLAVEAGKRILLTSHLLPDVERTCEAVVIVARGQVVACDRVEALRQAGSRPHEVVLRGDPARFLEEASRRGVEMSRGEGPGGYQARLPEGATGELLVEVAAATEAELTRLVAGRDTLEDIYLAAMAGAPAPQAAAAAGGVP